MTGCFILPLSFSNVLCVTNYVSATPCDVIEEKVLAWRDVVDVD